MGVADFSEQYKQALSELHRRRIAKDLTFDRLEDFEKAIIRLQQALQHKGDPTHAQRRELLDAATTLSPFHNYFKQLLRKTLGRQNGLVELLLAEVLTLVEISDALLDQYESYAENQLTQ
jgi:hypothetical protein